MKNILLEKFIVESLNEQEMYLELPDLTWKDLREFVSEVIKAYKKNKLKVFTKKATEKGVGFALVASGIPDVLELGKYAAEGVELCLSYILSKLYDINGENKVKDNPFKIDQSISKLIDDKAEKKFILYLGEKLKDKAKFPDNESIGSFEMTKELQDWLSGAGKKEYGGANVTK